jgi:hypothetical protein
MFSCSPAIIAFTKTPTLLGLFTMAQSRIKIFGDAPPTQ